MKNGKYAKRRGVASKTFALVVVMMLVIGCTIGGTIAWLTDETDSVTNTFTVGDINITLTETYNKDTNGDTTNDAWVGKMVPGNTLSKDPKVTVKAGSEACWLFVKVEKSSNLDDFITYTVNSGWTAGEGTGEGKNGVPVGVYYREVSALTTEDAADEVFGVLTDNQVTVKDAVTKAMMNDLQKDDATQPTLTFTAYAVQKDNIDTAAIAWEKLTPST